MKKERKEELRKIYWREIIHYKKRVYSVTDSICYDYYNGKISKQDYKFLKKEIRKEIGYLPLFIRWSVNSMFRRKLKIIKK